MIQKIYQMKSDKVYSLYQAKETTKKVYNNIIKSIQINKIFMNSKNK